MKPKCLSTNIEWIFLDLTVRACTGRNDTEKLTVAEIASVTKH